MTKRYDEMVNAIHAELLSQVKGALSIELHSHWYSLDKRYQNEKVSSTEVLIVDTGGIDIFIDDNKYEDIYEDPRWDTQIGHYHSTDLLWLILHWDTEIAKMKSKMDRIALDTVQGKREE